MSRALTEPYSWPVFDAWRISWTVLPSTLFDPFSASARLVALSSSIRARLASNSLRFESLARSPEEADLQAQGVDVLQQMFEEDAAPLAEALAPVDDADESPAAEADEAPAADTAEAAAEGEQPKG